MLGADLADDANGQGDGVAGVGNPDHDGVADALDLWAAQSARISRIAEQKASAASAAASSP